MSTSVTRGPSRSVAVLVAVMLVIPVLIAVWVTLRAPVEAKARAEVPPIDTGSALAATDPTPDRTPEIRGRIVDGDGNAVAGAAVHLISPRPPYEVVRDTTSDAAGQFSFAKVGTGRLRVVADHDPDGVVSSADLHAGDGESTEVTLVLSVANAVHGTVVNAERSPVAGATLSASGIPWAVPGASSDDAGAFRLPLVPDEATALLAVARGYKTAQVALGPGKAGEERVVHVRLVPAAAIEGDVLGAEGEPARADVTACAGEPYEARATSAADGTFTLPPTAIGCHAIAEQAGAAASDAAVVVEGARLTLRLKVAGSIEGVVVDDRGSGVATFRVGIESF